jgi:hypothetical protein
VHRSPAHQWLRGVVFDLFGDDGARPKGAVASDHEPERPKNAI